MSPDHLAGASSLLAGLPGRKGFGDASLIRPVPGSINLGGGNPDPDALPTGLYREAVRDYVEGETFADSLKYAPAPGTARLRSSLAADAGVAEDRVIVTTGGAHGLALSVLGTLSDGDTILVDDPVYPLFLRTLDLVKVDIVPVPAGANGISVAAVEELLRSGVRPTALFTVPTFQNPGGGLLPGTDRAALVALAERYGFTVFADDPYRDIRFPGVEAPDRRPFLDTDRVIEVNSFSKTLGPGLRLGWNIVPEHLVEQYVKLRNRLDGQSSGFLQEVVARIVEREEYGEALWSAGAIYERKAATLTTALEEELPGELEIVQSRGGFFLWFRMVREDLDFERLYDLAQDRGVSYQRGEWFSAGDVQTQPGRLRFSYSEVPESDLREAASRFAAAARELFQ